jgi:predicted outer membrane repeat protein
LVSITKGLNENRESANTFTAKITDAEFKNCDCSVTGGVLSVRNYHITEITNIQFLNSMSGSGGDIMFLYNNYVKVKNMITSGARADYQGGSIYIEKSLELTIQDSIFDDVVAVLGGVIYQDTAQYLNILNCSFSNVQTLSSGGAIYSTAALDIKVSNSNFTNFVASEGGLFFLKNNDSLWLDNVRVAEVKMTNGGTIYGERPYGISVKNSSFTNCSSPLGKGVFMFIRHAYLTTVDNCKFDRMQAMRGLLYLEDEESTEYYVLNSQITNSVIQKGLFVNSLTSASITGRNLLFDNNVGELINSKADIIPGPLLLEQVSVLRLNTLVAGKNITLETNPQNLIDIENILLTVNSMQIIQSYTDSSVIKTEFSTVTMKSFSVTDVWHTNFFNDSTKSIVLISSINGSPNCEQHGSRWLPCGL